ncbi:MAG TPA: pentapeptide repeat-containing protein [Chthoniobacterales bacterium]|nr:pentapeptide repeat-containing protein [Chthoniobacterales bacterium]
MFISTERTRPKPWSESRGKARHPLMVPVHWLEWASKWTVYWLSGSAVLEVLEYVGTLSIVFGVISYFAESGDRVKQKHYQAWQVINTAAGKGGSGGRIDALEELNQDNVPLVGVDVSDSFLQNIDLAQANLVRSNFSSSDIRGGRFDSARLEFSNFASANVRNGSFRKATLQGVTFQDADLNGADLGGADLTGANLSGVDLRNADLRDIKWQSIANIKSANIYGTKNASADFIHWALQNGAVSTANNED